MTDKTYDTIEIRGAKFAYERKGQGELLICVHPNISDIRSYGAVADKLASHFTVVNYSRRFAWPNEPIAPGQLDPWEAHAEDLAVLIQKLNLGPAHVIGNSSGATISLLLARDHPELVKSIMPIEPPCITLFFPAVTPSAWDILKLFVWHPIYFFPMAVFGATVINKTEELFKKGEDKAAIECFVSGVFGPGHGATVSDERWQQINQNLAPHKTLFCGGSMPKFSEQDAMKISVPTLTLRGSETSPAHRILAEYVTALIPGAKEVVIPGAGHLVHEDNPDAVVDAVRVFLHT